MARVNDCEVKEILNTDIDTTPFIRIANLLINEELADTGLSSSRLKQIELFLAAHFATVREPQIKSESVGGASVTYAIDSSGAGLSSTLYGKNALALDTTGKLQNLDKPKAKVECIRTQIKQ